MYHIKQKARGTAVGSIVEDYMWKFEQVMGVCVLAGCGLLIYAMTENFWVTVIGAPFLAMSLSALSQALCMSEPRQKKQ